MKLTNSTAVRECMERIEMFQTHIKHIDHAATVIHQRMMQKTIDYGNVRSLMIELELQEWRNLAMWGLTVSDEERDRIKAAVHQRFLRDDMNVATWLNGGFNPSGWLVADEKAFRAMARKAFSPSKK